MQRRRATTCNVRPLGVFRQTISCVGLPRAMGGHCSQPHSNKKCLLDGRTAPLRPKLSKTRAQLRPTKYFRTPAKTSLKHVRIRRSLRAFSVRDAKRCLRKDFICANVWTSSSCSNQLRREQHEPEAIVPHLKQGTHRDVPPQSISEQDDLVMALDTMRFQALP